MKYIRKTRLFKRILEMCSSIFYYIASVLKAEIRMPVLKVTDLSYLKQVSGGEHRFMKEMIKIFCEQVPEFISNLEKHLTEGNYLDLGREAHKAKSSVIIVGMNELGSKMKELQLLTEKKEGIEKYPEYVNDFKSQCLAAVDELEAYVQQI